jgi:hypothetical protein
MAPSWPGEAIFFGERTVPGIATSVVAIAAGEWFSIALKSDGTVVGWGDYGFGQRTPPVGLNNVVAISAGLRHALALKADGTVVSWGGNDVGQSALPASLPKAVAVSAGYYHSMVLLEADPTVTAPVIVNPSQVLGGYGSPFKWPVLAKNGAQAYAVTGLPGGLSIDGSTGIISGTPTAVGTFPITVTVQNGSGTGQSSIVVGILNTTGLTPTQIWRTNHFGITSNTGNAADLADPEHDGIFNLLEFGTNLNPTTASLMPGQIVRTPGNLKFTYTRSKTAMNEGVTFEVQWSNDLSGPSWSSVGVTESILSEDSSIQNVEALVPDGGNERLFVRLKVTR